MSRPKTDIRRIRLDAQGYDDNGAYYGAGDPVFLVTLPDGHEQAIRAKTQKAARTQAEARFAERNAAIPAAAPPRELEATAKAHARKLKERTSTYATTWTHPLTQVEQKLTIKHTRDYLGQGQDHIEIDSGKARSPHPLSETGYRSEFIAATDLINAGGPVSFVDVLIAKALRDKTWLAAESRKAQGDLFQWAEAQTEIAARKKTPARPAAGTRVTSRPAAKKGRAP